MKKGIVLGIIGLFVFLLLVGGCNSYNKMATMDEAITAQWQQVENVYQRRMDLIPNLVAVVKNYADFEKSTLTAVVEARANATKISIDPSKLDEASIQKFQQAQGAISTTLGRLLAVAENYPDLKANQNFLDLQKQLEGTENRITYERMMFNKTAQNFNTYIRRFPQNMFAGMFGFKQRAYFESQEGAEKAPDVGKLFKDK